MDFIDWVFDKHYILSTIFIPGLSFWWCVYKGLVIRGVIAFILMSLTAVKIVK